MSEMYLEDFAVGQIYGSGRITVEKERIKTFAAEFDPQPFHQDEEAARRSIFGGLAASGWHTAALTMRLLVEERTSNPPAASSVRASTSSAGHFPCDRVTSCTSRAKSSTCDRRNRARIREWSR